MLDSETGKEMAMRSPAKRSHRPVIGAILVNSKLCTKIGKRIKTEGIIETALVLAMKSAQPCRYGEGYRVG